MSLDTMWGVIIGACFLILGVISLLRPRLFHRMALKYNKDSWWARSELYRSVMEEAGYVLRTRIFGAVCALAGLFLLIGLWLDRRG